MGGLRPALALLLALPGVALAQNNTAAPAGDNGMVVQVIPLDETVDPVPVERPPAPPPVQAARGFDLPAAIVGVIGGALLGLGLTWALFVRPDRRRLAELTAAQAALAKAATKRRETAIAPLAPPERARLPASLPPREVTRRAPEPPAPPIDGVRAQVDDYRDLIAARAKPRQMQDVLDRAADARGLAMPAGSDEPALVTFDPDDPGQLLVAIAGDRPGEYAVLPTYNYLENFRLAFSAPVQNPELVRRLFDFDRDDSGNLRLVEPATIRVDEAGAVHKLRAGRMAGYQASA